MSMSRVPSRAVFCRDYRAHMVSYSIIERIQVSYSIIELNKQKRIDVFDNTLHTIDANTKRLI
jgi:hypothetical protein